MPDDSTADDGAGRQGGDPATAPFSGLDDFPGVAAASAAPDRLVGTTFANVRIVRLVAEGGMGRVYEGLQEKPRRTVAVKLIRTGLVSPRLVKRFEYEAQVLGRLTHPGIAHIHSMGVQEIAGDVMPYFVMEYVSDARPLTDYAVAHRLSTRERLTLFRQVCEAVAHGHNKGIVHRDLKPGNILVDGEGRPKVIDFGVARSTDGDVALTTMHTDIGQLVGTLQYMCPEQFAADGDDIDIRADVYALGVVLYELLVGRPPYDLRRGSVLEAARVIRDVTPVRLSSFDRVLRGDLETIAAKALEKDRSRRYTNATEFGADIGRYLAGEPIAARPAGFIDDVRRLLRRHRAVAAATVPLAAALVAAVTGLVFFAVAARRQGIKAEAESVRARASERDARLASEDAERQRALADAGAADALRRLYVANLQSIPGKIAEDDVTRARRLVDESQALLAPDATPFELRAFLWLLDTAAVVLPGRGGCLVPTDRHGGRRLAVTLSAEHGPRVWDAGSGTQVAALGGHAAAVGATAAGGGWVATGAADGSVRLWDTRDWTGRTLCDGGPAVTGLTFSPDGSRLLCRGAEPALRIFGPLPDGPVRECTGHAAPVTAVACAAAGGLVATGAADGDVRLFDLATGDVRAVFPGHTQAITAITWSADGLRLASGSQDCTVRVWSVASAAAEPFVSRHAQAVTGVAFSADGLLVLTASLDQGVWITALDPTPLRPRMSHHGGVRGIAVSGDGKMLASAAADGVVRLWAMPPGGPGPEGMQTRRLATMFGHASAVEAVEFSDDGEVVLSLGDDGTCRLWGLRPEAMEPALVGHAQGLDAVAFSPDGTRIATTSRDGTARVWDAVTQRPLFVVGSPHRPGRAIAYSHDGSRLVIGSEEPRAHLADAATGVVVGRLEGHEGGVLAVAFGPDDTLVATGSADGTARIWDARTRAEKRVCRGHTAAVTSLAFSPDGRRLATASDDGSVRLWDVGSGTEVGRCTGHARPVRAVAFDGSGTRLATAGADGTARVWDAATGAEVSRLEHRGDVFAVVFSPDGRRLATGGRDGAVRIWDPVRQDELAALQRHRNAVVGLAFDAAGTVLASASWDNTCRLWCGTRTLPAATAPAPRP
jgi:eukaryotic-like serine/threonine-protein kinase